MADFEEYAEIISRCMGYRENEFLRVYQKNINIQIDEARSKFIINGSNTID